MIGVYIFSQVYWQNPEGSSGAATPPFAEGSDINAVVAECAADKIMYFQHF